MPMKRRRSLGFPKPLFFKKIIRIVNRQKDVAISASQLKKIVDEVLHFEGSYCEEVSIHFVSAKKIALLHQQYFGSPSVTDCISFPIDASGETCSILGDVFVCPKTAIEYVALHGGDLYEEIILYVIHGLLHLLGYDDLNATDKRKMRRRESKHMSNLREKNLI